MLEKIICSFLPARHTRNFPARKIKLVGFPVSYKVSSQQAEERQLSTSYVKMGVAKGLKFTLQLGGGGADGDNHLSFKSFLIKLCLKCSEANPSAVTNFSASSSELLFCRQARFLWGTDKVRNSLVGCPWILYCLKMIMLTRLLLPPGLNSFGVCDIFNFV